MYLFAERHALALAPVIKTGFSRRFFVGSALVPRRPSRVLRLALISTSTLRIRAAAQTAARDSTHF